MDKRQIQEQIQEDVITYMEGIATPQVFADGLKQTITDDICDIVINNIKGNA